MPVCQFVAFEHVIVSVSAPNVEVSLISLCVFLAEILFKLVLRVLVILPFARGTALFKDLIRNPD